MWVSSKFSLVKSIVLISVNYHGLTALFNKFLQSEHDITNLPVKSYALEFGVILKSNNIEEITHNQSVRPEGILTINDKYFNESIGIWCNFRKEQILV